MEKLTFTMENYLKERHGYIRPIDIAAELGAAKMNGEIYSFIQPFRLRFS